MTNILSYDTILIFLLEFLRRNYLDLQAILRALDFYIVTTLYTKISFKFKENESPANKYSWEYRFHRKNRRANRVRGNSQRLGKLYCMRKVGTEQVLDYPRWLKMA